MRFSKRDTVDRGNLTVNMSSSFPFGRPEGAKERVQKEPLSFVVSKEATRGTFSHGPTTQAASFRFSFNPSTQASCSGFSFGETAQRTFGTATSDDIVELQSSKVFRKYKVFHDLKKLFLSGEDCNVIIKVKGQEFKAHRTIIAARSPVLKSTFQNNMKEKDTEIVNIEDCDPSSFSDFLGFLYCGEVKLSDENAFSLFNTADKYDVQDLKEVCIEFMKDNISVDSFCKTITLSLEHDEKELTTVATNYFIKNARNIVKTVAWQTFLAENVIKGNELVIKAFDAAAKLESPLFKKQRMV